MIKDLIKLANKLDNKGLGKEADQLDRIIKKIAQQNYVAYYMGPSGNYGPGKCFAEVVIDDYPKIMSWDGEGWGPIREDEMGLFNKSERKEGCPDHVAPYTI